MDSILLTNKEIQDINLLVEEASKVPAIEYIIIIAYYDSYYKREQIRVITGVNNQPRYNALLTGKEGRRDTFEEEQKIGEIIYNLNRNYLGRLRFNDTVDYGDIKDPENIYCSAALSINLINGTILFDRFGEITAYRDEALADPETFRYKNILEIYNIDSILKGNNILTRTKQYSQK